MRGSIWWTACRPWATSTRPGPNWSNEWTMARRNVGCCCRDLRSAARGFISKSSPRASSWRTTRTTARCWRRAQKTLTREFMVEYMRYKADKKASEAAAMSDVKDGLEEQAKKYE